MDKLMKNEDGGNKPLVPEEGVTDQAMEHKIRKRDNDVDTVAKKNHKHGKHKRNQPAQESDLDQVENNTPKKKTSSAEKEAEKNADNNVGTANRESSLEKKSTRKKQKINELLKESASDRKRDGTQTEKEPSSKSNLKHDIIDDGEVPFSDLFTADASESDIKRSEKRDADSVSGLVSFLKKRKAKKQSSALQLFSSELEIGLGGSSAWD